MISIRGLKRLTFLSSLRHSVERNFNIVVPFAQERVLGQSEPVAFSLGLDTHVTVNDATTVPFGQAITLHNTGNSVENGVFNCTVPGLYEFQVYSLTKNDKYLFLELYKNSELVASLGARTPADYSSAGNAAILDLKYGDLVRVLSRRHTTVNLFGKEDQICTTFTGVRLGSLHNVDSEESLASFSVALTHNQHVVGGQSVHYDKVFVDTMNGYDKNTGVYTAPTDGIYMFHFFSLAATKNGEIWQELYHNGNYICSLYALITGSYGDGGNTAILQLSAQDQVTIKANSGLANDLYGRTNEIYSTFSGTQLMTEMDIEEPVYGPGYAFSVGLSSGYTVPDGGKVVFDRIFLDFNQAYNHLTGEFVAPVSGLYEFNYHIMGSQNSTIWLELYHNNKYVNSVYSHTPLHHGSGGNAVVIDVEENDVVYVRARGANSLYGQAHGVYCTFSGYLLNPMNSILVIG